MSKAVKELISKHLHKKLEGVNELLLVNVVGLDAIRTTALRKDLRAKKINLLVIKNSLARLATEGTALAPAFEGAAGTLAVVWGETDIVQLAKEVTRLAGDKLWAPFESRGGVLDGQRLSPAEVEAVSKWPTRQEQLSILVGQILSPGARLASQLNAAGGALVSQIKSRGEEEESAPSAEPAD